MNPQEQEAATRRLTSSLLDMLNQLGLVDCVRVSGDRPTYRFNERGRAMLKFLLDQGEITP